MINSLHVVLALIIGTMIIAISHFMDGKTVFGVLNLFLVGMLVYIGLEKRKRLRQENDKKLEERSP